MNRYAGELLTVPVLFARVFATFGVEDDYFVALHQRIAHAANNFCALNCWRAHADCFVGSNEQNIVELYCLTALSILDVVNKELLPLLNFELLTVDCYNCVHH